MRDVILGYAVTIDGVYYRSMSIASKALGISRDRIASRIAEYGRYNLTSQELATRKPPKPQRQADKPPAKPKSSSPLSWEFVYSRISSSPKTRGVDSSPAAYQSA